MSCNGTSYGLLESGGWKLCCNSYRFGYTNVAKRGDCGPECQTFVCSVLLNDGLVDNGISRP